MPVYVCRKCGRLYSFYEYLKNEFCRECGTLLYPETSPLDFEKPHALFRTESSLTLEKQELNVTSSKPPLKLPSIVPPEKFDVNFVLEKIKRNFRKALVYEKFFPEKPAKHGTGNLSISRALKESLERQGITKLYSHQEKAIRNSLSGRNVIVSTATASGKTLCFNIPVLDSIVRRPDSRALYIYPTKALAQDQIRKIAAFRDDYPHREKDYRSGYYFTMSLGGQKVYFGRYEGPTLVEDRKKLRASAT